MIFPYRKNRTAKNEYRSANSALHIENLSRIEDVVWIKNRFDLPHQV
jgi:hypothetical protein